MSKDAADASLLQESTFYPENLPSLSSKLFEPNQTLQLINLGQGTSLSADRDNNNSQAVLLIRKALKIIIPEIPNVSATKKAQALSLSISGGFDSNLVVLVRYFQQQTLELNANIDGIIGRKTLHELDKALNRISDYDEETARTIFNYGQSTVVSQTTVVLDASGVGVNLYSEPIPNSPVLFRLQENDILYVLREGGDTATDWYYVKVLSGNRDKQLVEPIITGGAELYDEIFNKGYELNGYIQGSSIHKSWNTHPSKMPDVYSKIHRLPTTIANDSEYLLNLIKETYFDPVTLRSVNEDGIIDDSENISFPGTTFPDAITHENMLLLKFCLNVLIYSNNQVSNLDLVSDNERSIYVKSPGQWLTENDINEARQATETHFSANHTSATAYYDQFLTELIAASAGYNYVEELDGGGIKLRIGLTEGYLMWLPSRQFMTTMWNTYKFLMPVNGHNSGDFLVEFAKKAVKKMFPYRSLGFRQRVELGATFLIPIGIDFVGDISIWREDTNSHLDYTLKISAYGEIRGGLDTGVGFDLGFWNGKRGSKEKKAGIGVTAGADLQAGEKMSALIEFEIPITGQDPISTNLAAAAYGAIGLLSTVVSAVSAVFPYAGFYAFQKAAETVNFNLWNYVTKFKLYKASYLEAGTGASATFKYGVPSEEQNQQYNWLHPEDVGVNGGLTNKNLLPPFLLSLFSGTAASVGLGGGVEYGYGVEVEVEYPFAMDNCYDPVRDIRVPSRIKLSSFGEGSVHFDFYNSLSLGLFGLNLPVSPIPDINIHQGLGIKLMVDFDIAKELGGSNVTKNYVLTLDNFLKKTSKYIGFYNFSGNLDLYQGSGYESCYYFNLGRIINAVLPNENLALGSMEQTLQDEGFINKFTNNFLEIQETFSHVNFQKRIGLSLFNRKYRRRIKKQQISKRWLAFEADQTAFRQKAKQSFFSMNPYLDFNYTIAGKDYINFIKGIIIFIRVLTALNKVMNDDTVAEEIKNYISDKYKDIIDPQNDVDTIYTKLNDASQEPQMQSYLNQYGGGILASFKTLLDITVFEMSERAGFYKGDDTVTEYDAAMYTMFAKLAFRYFRSMYDVNMALHAEVGGGFGFTGELSEGLKVRLRVHVESKVVVHSDLIKDDGCFPFSHWFGVISDLIGADPLKLYQSGPANEYTPADEIKERVPLFENGYYISVLNIDPNNPVPYDPANNTKSNFLDTYIQPYLKMLFDKQF